MGMNTKQKLMYFENFINTFNSNNESVLLDALEMTKREAVLEVHKYKISQLSGKDQRWHTYIPADTKRGIKEIKKPTERELINFLVEFYGLSGSTVSELYADWLKYKETITGSMATIRRHEQHWNKYFVNEKSKLLNMNVAKVDTLTLQSECNQLVKKYNMTRREWQNVKTIINGMFEYAYEKHFIKENPCERLKITVKFRQETKKPSETQVYQTKEYTDILAYLDKMYSETEDLVFMAVKFQFYTGLRVGELVALKWKDVDLSKKTLHVIREEASDAWKDETGWHEKRTVVEHTKTNQDRIISLLPKSLELLKKIEPRQKEDWIFHRGNERITERQVNYVLEKYAERNNTITKSSHKLRKTYASRMNAAGVPLDVIQRDLGHADAKTTLKYLYNAYDESTTYDLKANAI